HRRAVIAGRRVSGSRTPGRQLPTRYPAERFRASHEVGGRDACQSAGLRYRPLGAGLLRDHDSQARPSSGDPIRRRSVPTPPGLDPAEITRSALTDPGRKPGVHGGRSSTEGEALTDPGRKRGFTGEGPRWRERPTLTPGASPGFTGEAAST